MSSVTRLLLVVVLAFAAPAAAKVVKPFPRGFLWGAAISAFQSEMGFGAPVDTGTDWWTWVRDPENLANDRVSGDLPEQGPGFWTMFKRDAKLARTQLKHNALRFSIEWSRIFPTSTAGVDISAGVTPAALAALDALADPAAVEHYRAVLTALRAKKLRPFVTLNHFTLPLWIHDPVATRAAFVGVHPTEGPVPAGLTQAGWLDPTIATEFTKYAAWAGWKLGDLVDFWCTINEPGALLVGGYLNAAGVGGNFPPGVFSMAAVAGAIPNLVAAHVGAYDALHSTDTVDADRDGTPVRAGIVHNMIAFHPEDPTNPADVTSAVNGDYVYNRAFLNAITLGDADFDLDGTIEPGEHRVDYEGRGDFIGINYYTRGTVRNVGPLTPFIPLFDFLPTFSYASALNPGGTPCPAGRTCTEFGWEIYPQGLREVLTFAGSFGLPIYITENGLADSADTKRAQYIFDHLATLQGVIQDGVADVRGYFHWSLTDNFEWVSGYYPAFGLFAYDHATGKRTLRAGARPLRVIAQRNGITGGLVRQYAP